MKRRDFLTSASAAGAAASLSAAQRSGEDAEPVRIGLVGAGGRGTSLLRTMLDLPGVEITAIADLDDNALTRARTICTGQGHAKPVAYARGPQDFRRMVTRHDWLKVPSAGPKT